MAALQFVFEVLRKHSIDPHISDEAIGATFETGKTDKEGGMQLLWSISYP